MPNITTMFKLAFQDIRFQINDVFGREGDDFNLNDITHNKRDLELVDKTIDEIGLKRTKFSKSIKLSDGSELTVRNNK